MRSISRPFCGVRVPKRKLLRGSGPLFFPAWFGEEGHADGGLFERRRVRGAIGVAAGEPVDGLVDGVERHVELLALHAVGDEHLHADLAVGGTDLDVACRW